MIRQAAEKVIQGNDEMKKNSQKLLMHSEAVGRVIYAKYPTIRSEWVHSMEQLESAPDNDNEAGVDEEKEKEMNDLEQADEQARIQYAQNFDLEDRMQRNINRRHNSRCNIPPLDRNRLMKLVYKEVFGGVYQTFPGLFVYILLSYSTFVYRSHTLAHHVDSVSRYIL